jgi:hypothetical protein
MNNKDTINEIEKALIWYEGNSTKADIYRLLEFQDKLSIRSCNLAQMVAESKGEALGAYFERKVTFSVNKMNFINGGETVSKADSMAESASKQDRQREKEAIQYSEHLRLLLSQVNKVLSSCQQRLSFMKSEWERSHRMSGDNTKIIA